VGNAKVGMRVLQAASETLSTRYFHTDHLGSVSVITDENGNVLERLSYDAWGKRRFPNGSDDPSNSITSQTTRGFTGEEQLQVASLVHLNGRVYDSLLARFTSADPTVTDPTNPQGWNRYSYVGNDPLAFTDPNGFSWLSGFFHSVSHFFTSVGNFLKTNAIARAIFQIGVTVLLNVALPGLGFAAGSLSLAVASAAGGAAITAGVTGGNLSQVLKAGLIAGVTAAAFFEVGDLTYGPAHASPGFDSPNFSASNYLENIAGHALVGCGSAAASGGKCGAGALAGAAGSAAAPAISGPGSLFPNAQTDIGQRIGGTLVSATVGGFASLAGGGKFANGAITAAFGYLSNSLSGRSDAIVARDGVVKALELIDPNIDPTNIVPYDGNNARVLDINGLDGINWSGSFSLHAVSYQVAVPGYSNLEVKLYLDDTEREGYDTIGLVHTTWSAPHVYDFIFLYQSPRNSTNADIAKGFCATVKGGCP